MTRTALIPGGSQGIGRGIALSLARLEHRVTLDISLIILVSRSEALMQEIKIQAERESEGKTRVIIIVADLSLLTGMRKAAEDIEGILNREGRKVDLMVSTQGAAPNGMYTPSGEGIDKHFAVSALSRFALPYYMLHPSTISSIAPLISSKPSANHTGLFSPSALILNICYPPGPSSKAIDLGDLDMGKAAVRGEWGNRGLRDMPRVGNAGGVVLDCVTMELNDRHTTLSFAHLNPGLIPTGRLASGSLPRIFIVLITLIERIGLFLGLVYTVEAFSVVMVGMLEEGVGKREGEEGDMRGIWKKRGTRMGVGAWVMDKGNRVKTYEAMEKVIQTGRLA